MWPGAGLGHLADLLGGVGVVHHQLEVDDADSVPAVVVDVLGPGAALNVQQLPARDTWITGRRGQTGSCGVKLLHERLKM